MVAPSRTPGSITQLTTTNNTPAIDISGKFGITIDFEHVNGTGTITAGAEVTVSGSHDGITYYPIVQFIFGTTASSTEKRRCSLGMNQLPADSIRIEYTEPTGSTGHTLDAEYTTIDSVA